MQGGYRQGWLAAQTLLVQSEDFHVMNNYLHSHIYEPEKF